MGAETAVYQVSLIAAYIAGMVALFAPCCISYLFPSYLGNVFRERKQVLFMTLVYSLGIFVVMMPIVLGARVLSSFITRTHDVTYFLGGFFMITVAVLSFIGIKLPMPHLSVSSKGKSDIASTFTLGVFSGITSACCAPVLIGVLALSSLSPTLFLSIGVGVAYVLGMVTPLYLASALIHKRNILEKPILKRKIMSVRIGGGEYPVFVSNIVAAGIFGITGTLLILLTYLGKLGRSSVTEAAVMKNITAVAFKVSEVTKGIPGLDFVFVASVAGLFFWYWRRGKDSN